MLERKYKLPVEQFVIFLGSSKPQMATRLVSKRMRFEFPLISFADLDYRIFLNSNQPEEVVLGVLADFKGEKPERALQKIIERIEETAAGDFSLKRYFQQLRVLAQLRKLEKKLKELVMDNIGKYVSQERDVAYMIGQDKAREQEQIKFVTNLLTSSDFTAKKNSGNCWRTCQVCQESPASPFSKRVVFASYKWISGDRKQTARSAFQTNRARV